MLICHCRGVSERAIRKCVRQGASSLKEVARATGAGARCGSCRAGVREVIRSEKGRSSTPKSTESKRSLEFSASPT